MKARTATRIREVVSIVMPAPLQELWNVDILVRPLSNRSNIERRELFTRGGDEPWFERSDS
jgi:hypothetical protein